jgi:hypothetical protein
MSIKFRVEGTPANRRGTAIKSFDEPLREMNGAKPWGMLLYWSKAMLSAERRIISRNAERRKETLTKPIFVLNLLELYKLAQRSFNNVAEQKEHNDETLENVA